MVQHEDDLRSQRLGYLLTLNGLLFAALAFAWKGPHTRSIVSVLAGIGVLVSASTFAAMILSDRAIRYLRKRAPTAMERSELMGETVEPETEFETIPVGLSKSQMDELKRQDQTSQKKQNKKKKRDFSKAIQPWHSLPVVLGAGWVAVWVVAFFRFKGW
jgi:hypothetical protein